MKNILTVNTKLAICLTALPVGSFLCILLSRGFPFENGNWEILFVELGQVPQNHEASIKKQMEQARACYLESCLHMIQCEMVMNS